jgi:hypothetical protein
MARRKSNDDQQESIAMSKTHLALLPRAMLILALCGSGPTVSVADEAPAPASSVLASADGQQAGTRIDITKLKRSSGGTVTLDYVLVNDSDATLNTSSLLRDERGPYRSSDGIALIDAAGKKKYLVIRDSDNKCLCSTDIEDVKPKSRVNLWAKFPAPPEDVKEISIAIPHFQPMDDVPISR